MAGDGVEIDGRQSRKMMTVKFTTTKQRCNETAATAASERKQNQKLMKEISRLMMMCIAAAAAARLMKGIFLINFFRMLKHTKSALGMERRGEIEMPRGWW
jgi:hypothetical protein